MRLLCLSAAVALAACQQGNEAPAAVPVDVDYGPRVVHDWEAWSYEPGVVAVAEEPESQAHLRRPGAPPDYLPGVMVMSNPLVVLSADGYLDASGRVFQGGQATRSDVGRSWHHIERRADAMVESLRKLPSKETVVTVWSKPGQPAWSKTLTPAPDSVGAALSPDGAALAFIQTTSDRMLELSLYDTASGAKRWSLRVGGAATDRGAGYPIGFSAEGDRIVFMRYLKDRSVQVRGLDGTLIADVDRALLPLRSVDRGFGFTFGLSADCLWESRIYYSERSDSNTHATNSWDCDFSVYSVKRNKLLGDAGFRPRGNALYRRIFDSDPYAKDCPARLVVSDGPGISVVSNPEGAAGTPGRVRVRTFPNIPGCN